MMRLLLTHQWPDINIGNVTIDLPRLCPCTDIMVRSLRRRSTLPGGHGSRVSWKSKVPSSQSDEGKEQGCCFK